MSSAQMIGCYEDLPVGILSVKRTQGICLGKGEGCERIGLVRLSNWKCCGWKIGGQNRVIRLY